MKVKRFFAQSMAEALRQVRDQMGPDAVILSNRRVDGGVEIVTALDYDENMARQRLGDAAREATNGSRLAELQAEQHRRLEDELGRSRDRIREVREKRARPMVMRLRVGTSATLACRKSRWPTMTWWLKSRPLPALPIPVNLRKCARRSVPSVTWSVPGVALNPNKQR